MITDHISCARVSKCVRVRYAGSNKHVPPLGLAAKSLRFKHNDNHIDLQTAIVFSHQNRDPEYHTEGTVKGSCYLCYVDELLIAIFIKQTAFVKQICD